MISMEPDTVEVQPASPPSTSQCQSPDIRVADSSSPIGSSASSPLGSPTLSMGSPTLSTPPILFQPFLNLPILNKVPKVLPFSIDNILRPTFGRPIFPSAFVPPKSPSPKPVQIKKEPEHPVDLSAKSGNNNNNEPKKDDGCPPGMVRGPNGQLWPAWVFCTRYSDRPSSGPRSRKIKKASDPKSPSDKGEKRPRTAFSSDQLGRLKKEFDENRYLTEERRKNLADELGLHENQIKIWFQNKRAKLKKSTGQRGELAQMLAAQGLYNHTTVPVDEDDNPLY